MGVTIEHRDIKRMALALYDPARFDRSPASIFSISNPTVNADVRLSNLRIENQVSVLDLRSAMRIKSDRHRSCFAAVLDRCYARIRRCASVMREECTFEIPLFLPGFPVYDVERCVRFVASHLAKNGFRVERMPVEYSNEENEDEEEGGRTLVISWSTHDPNDEPPPPPLAFRPIPKIQNNDTMMPSWDPRRPVLQQRHLPPSNVSNVSNASNLSNASNALEAPRQSETNRHAEKEYVVRRPQRAPPQPTFGSAFAPLVPPERLLQPVSEFSPPPFGSFGSFGTLPLAVGTRMSIPVNRSGRSQSGSRDVSETDGVRPEGRLGGRSEGRLGGRSEGRSDGHREGRPEGRRPARSISEFRPNSKFALN